ncbi:glycosyltransferase family 4 protein [Candidatus Chloroploca mongolica]|uniref:glycosyltransferase family 4 protein n=1 Tax=Candidatus Chloroploca mongolica TaxID=2528176 RepID=UPI001C20C6CF|nr:glycosyltransferase family 1 protein [Candidatus Chloroploca mongolica]
MRIGLDARYATEHFPGIGRYTVGLARAFAEISHGHTLVLIVDPRQLRESRYDLAAIAAMPGVETAHLAAGPFSLKQQVALPSLARRLGLDVLHSPYVVKPYLGLPCPSVVTVYDLIGWRYPRTLSARGRLFYRLTMDLALRTATRILTISESSRADLAYVYPYAASRLVVTPLAAERRFQPQPAEVVAQVRQRYALPNDYVLYVGSQKAHKNLERLVRAWERMLEFEARQTPGAWTLVLAGHAERGQTSLHQFVKQRGLADRVRFVPNVADEDLPALYSGATVFAFPSYYEGFGLPPLEAMACGVPVLCAYASSLPEVVGEAALTVDPFNALEMAEGLWRLLNNPLLRRDLAARGARRARDFSWRRTALGTLRVYEGLAARS